MDEKRLVERVREFYNPEISKWSEFFFVVNTPKGRKLASFNGKRKIYLTFGKQIEGDIGQMNDAELEKQGIVVVTEKELGKMLFPEHYEKIRPIIEPDDRMKKYLEGVKRGIGLLEIKHGWDEEDFIPVKQYKIWANLTGSGCVDVGQLNNGLYVAQFSVRVSIDDYDVTRIYFSKFPSKKDIITAVALEDIETYFDMHGWDRAKFYCLACCSEKHFCDVKSDNLKQKFDYFRTQYCGCEN